MIYIVEGGEARELVFSVQLLIRVYFHSFLFWFCGITGRKGSSADGFSFSFAGFLLDIWIAMWLNCSEHCILRRLRLQALPFVHPIKVLLQLTA